MRLPAFFPPACRRRVRTTCFTPTRTCWAWSLHEPIAQSPGIPADAPDAAIFEGGSRINGIPCFFVNGRCFVPQAGFEELFDLIAGMIDGHPRPRLG